MKTLKCGCKITYIGEEAKDYSEGVSFVVESFCKKHEKEFQETFNLRLGEDKEIREITKRVLEELHKDNQLDVNQYQSKDFDDLIKRIKGDDKHD